jgi:hypothetical protein
MVETGDRVQFKAKLPDRDEPERQHHVGWSGEPGHSEPITRTWSRYFGGLNGVVIAVDPPNQTATVRGRDREGNPYTVEMPLDCIKVTAKVDD